MFIALLGNGGGGGGRIAVYLGQRSIFHGRIRARPGTVFIETANGEDVHRQLHIDGADFGSETQCDYPCDLTTINTVDTINDVYLTNKACLAVKAVSLFHYFSLIWQCVF